MALAQESKRSNREKTIHINKQVNRASLRAAADQEEWRSVCGFRRDLVQGREGFGPSFHYLRIFDSRKHRHHLATEFCVGIGGKGAIVIEDQPVEIGQGDVVVVPPKTWHTYKSDESDPLHLMIVVNPGIRSEIHDIEFFDEAANGESIPY
ncbi:cupin domain-containing protein [Candidatus Sumerlaeota bacterium]|nr:cupin domain-containing protein [Candidatus Sumerlaeota bacterium]